MARLPRHTLLLILGLPVVSAAPPGRVYAQLVRQGTTTPGQQAATGQNSMKSQTSLGKKRLSQEVQLTGDASWMDTGIDVQPGEHVVITATGKLRYSEATSSCPTRPARRGASRPSSSRGPSCSSSIPRR